MTWANTLPVLALLVGILISELSHYYREHRTNMRSDARWAAEFQRETLVEVQRLADEFENSLESTLFPQLAEFDRTGRFPEYDRYSEELREHMTLRRQLIARLQSVADSDIRSTARHYLDATLRAVQSPPAGMTDNERRSMVRQAGVDRQDPWTKLSELIGQRLRGNGQ